MNMTKPYSFGCEIHEIMEADHSLTIETIADKFKKKADWVGDRLSLAELHPFVGRLVDDGKITLKNALLLSEFTPLQQLYLRNDAISMQLKDFKTRCDRFVAEVVQ